MDLKSFQQQSAIHRRLYDSLRERIRQNHAGKYIALANGQLVAAATSFEEAKQVVDSLQPVPEYYLIFPAEMEPPFELSYDLGDR